PLEIKFAYSECCTGCMTNIPAFTDGGLPEIGASDLSIFLRDRNASRFVYWSNLTRYIICSA
ncbi:hypothetical protein V5O48_014552, partial [Marasmius crinis-equi]